MQSLKITSDWTPADESDNRLELAHTEKEGVVAIRDNFDPDRTVFATSRQLNSLVRAAESRGPISAFLGR